MTRFSIVACRNIVTFHSKPYLLILPTNITECRDGVQQYSNNMSASKNYTDNMSNPEAHTVCKVHVSNSVIKWKQPC